MATPLTAPVKLTGLDGTNPFTVTTSVVVDPDTPLFAGHYPDFPIFPGVCLIECVHQSVLLAARWGDREVALQQICGTRFLAPAFPGDKLTTTVRVTERNGRWDCEGRLCRDDQDIAKVQLSYWLPGGHR